MPADAWITLAVIMLVGVALVSERFPPTATMGAAVVLLYLVGVVDAGEAFGGFANIAPLTVAALYVLAGAADITGALSGLTQRAIGAAPSSSERRSLARMVFPTAAASGFIANTPLVAMIAPRISAWARQSRQSPSRYLMPLSYAAILGGTITVLGTSTNLVISGLLDAGGFEPLAIFEITPAGLPIAVVTAIVLVLIGPTLLPERQSPDEALARTREFTVELIVTAKGPLVGQSVTEARLRTLDGVFLVEILREQRTIAPVSPDQTLEAGVRLVFSGVVERVVDLQGMQGLVMSEEHHFAVVRDICHQFYEAVVAESSVLHGSTLKAANFRSAFGGAVIAVHRAGHRLGGRLGDLPLRSGDVLLVVGPEGFRRDMRGRADFSVVAPYEIKAPLRRRSARVVELATLALIVVTAIGLVDLTRAAMGVALALVALRVITPGEARRAINLDIIAMIAFSLGLGAAAEASGLAESAANRLVDATSTMGDLGLVAGIAIATLIATEVLSNNAAAALMFPVASSAALAAGVDIRPLAVVILIVASCSFLTPIGYQTNTMMWSMGGYRFTDFTRVGAPLTLTTLIGAVVLVPLVMPL